MKTLDQLMEIFVLMLQAFCLVVIWAGLAGVAAGVLFAVAYCFIHLIQKII